MAMTMRLDVVSAEEELFSGMVQEVNVPGELGGLGIFPRHSQLISRLKAGELRYRTEAGDEASLFVSGGVMEVQPHVVTVLADTAVRADDLDEAEAQEAIQRAESLLEGKDPEDYDYEKARIELETAKAQMEMLQRISAMRH